MLTNTVKKVEFIWADDDTSGRIVYLGKCGGEHNFAYFEYCPTEGGLHVVDMIHYSSEEQLRLAMNSFKDNQDFENFISHHKGEVFIT